MIDPEAIAKLQARIPKCEFVARIAELDAVAGELPFEVFREPVAINELNDSGHNRLVNLSAEYVTGWCRHMAYSMVSVRRTRLEPDDAGG